jgi:hypothetical protein
MFTRTLGLTFVVALVSLTSMHASARTALQKHVAFFDRADDGMITWTDTYEGCRALGFSMSKSAALASAINAGLGTSTGGTTFTINVANIHKGKHDSDSDIYDENGNYVQKKFDALFERFDTDRDNGISEDEFAVLYSRNYESATGSVISRFEFGLLMDIAGETRTKTSTWSACSSWWCPSYTSTSTYKVLTRSDLSGFYDGSLLYELAGEQAPF